MSAPSYNDPDNTLLRKIAEGISDFVAGIPPAVQAALDVLTAALAGKQDSLGFTPENVANKSDQQSMNDSSATLYPTQLAAKSRIEGFASITYASPTELDFDSLPYRQVNITGDLTLTAVNMSAAKSITLLIVNNASIHNLSFPSGWKFFGAAAPTTIAASKQALLTLTAFGSTEGSVKAAYAVEP